MSFICHIHNYTEYNQQWNAFSASNPSTHLEQQMLFSLSLDPVSVYTWSPDAFGWRWDSTVQTLMPFPKQSVNDFSLLVHHWSLQLIHIWAPVVSLDPNTHTHRLGLGISRHPTFRFWFMIRLWNNVHMAFCCKYRADILSKCVLLNLFCLTWFQQKHETWQLFLTLIIIKTLKNIYITNPKLLNGSVHLV